MTPSLFTVDPHILDNSDLTKTEVIRHWQHQISVLLEQLIRATPLLPSPPNSGVYLDGNGDWSAPPTGTGGGGDMYKATYDTNNNGVVDTADSLAWSKLTGVPATFPPGAHAPTHLDNGTDPVPVVTTSRTGLTPILSGDGSTFLNGAGGWTKPTTLMQDQWNYRNQVVMADPGAGNIRWNNALAGSATQIAIDNLSANGSDRTNLLKSLLSGDVIQVQDQTNAANWIRYQLTAAPTINTGWVLLSVATVDGSGTNPTNNDTLTLSFTVTGGVGGVNGGDMTKAVYDTDNNGVVDTCDSLAYSRLTGVPTSFPPSAHANTHITGGSDAIPVATTSATGLTPILSGSASQFLNGTGAFSTPSVGAPPSSLTDLGSPSGNSTINTGQAFLIAVNLNWTTAANWTLTLQNVALGSTFYLRLLNSSGATRTFTITATNPSAASYTIAVYVPGSGALSGALSINNGNAINVHGVAYTVGGNPTIQLFGFGSTG